MERRTYRSILGSARTALVVLATGFAVAVGAAPASADVTVDPVQAIQGDPARLTFRVTEDRPGAHTTRIQLRMPDSLPVAETWPMSVPDWAPQITMRTLDEPLPGLHHGQTGEVVAAITWIRATPPGDNPGPAELSISLGPMPQQADQMVFTVVQTYSDGFVANWDGVAGADGARPERPAAVVRLVAPPVAPPPAGQGDQADQADPAGAGQDDGGLSLLDIGLAGALLLGLGIAGWYLFRDRWGVADLPADDAPSTDQPGADQPPTADTSSDQAAGQTDSDQAKSDRADSDPVKAGPAAAG
ncbi:YcnI family protein [Solwaraspora sp. WMMD1047]|uniref:YcnI family copper-binding membrane protein n=1 Tax=Solwaraspora sp. WMMD1047 TaxID=3016102 RepID=UPI002416A8CE|nr:YcnI family protein [Solwaraspora sp. WMMD1047]MDG4831313.1 YcnI family protein [Solwaraspora sp. WMMD1047]